MSGMFIVVEGPNGVGKTTIATFLAARLREEHDLPVHLTAEPSDTPLGRLLRTSEAVLKGRALALAIAADRYAHLDDLVVPLLAAGHHVISDRYVQSSLVLQRLDGLPLSEVWSYNALILPPTVSFYLKEQPEIIGKRLSARSKLSRFERIGSPGRELALYDEAMDFLGSYGWKQAKVNCRNRTPEEIVADILRQLKGYATDQAKRDDAVHPDREHRCCGPGAC